jgi:hypothetical protein
MNEPLKLTGAVTAVSRSGIRLLRIRNFQLLSDGGREAGEFNLGAGHGQAWSARWAAH